LVKDPGYYRNVDLWIRLDDERATLPEGVVAHR
jgi:hypothetical protein